MDILDCPRPPARPEGATRRRRPRARPRGRGRLLRRGLLLCHAGRGRPRARVRPRGGLPRREQSYGRVRQRGRRI
ncbi:hypothetical protein BRD15_09130, partial [Halobacteriales archaeon SW_6_65_15]